MSTIKPNEIFIFGNKYFDASIVIRILYLSWFPEVIPAQLIIEIIYYYRNYRNYNYIEIILNIEISSTNFYKISNRS